MEEELDMEDELERELAAEQEELLEVEEDEDEDEDDDDDDVDYEDSKHNGANDKLSEDDEKVSRNESLRYKNRMERDHTEDIESFQEDRCTGALPKDRLQGPLMKILNVEIDRHQTDTEKPALAKVRSLPANFTYNPPAESRRPQEGQ